MGRRKIEIKPIRDDRNRSVTFLKRKGGLFKKAHELSVLCSVEVAVIIFGHNKKLYEYSSGDITETIQRFQYYGGAHEHKGPADFADKNGGGDEDDDEDVGEDVGQDGQGEGHMDPQQHPMMHAQMQNHPGFQNVRHGTPSNSPPMPNGAMPQFNRGPSPLPPGMSRPSSRASQHPGHIRRTSSNLAPPHHPHTQGPPPPGNYAYTPNPPFYQPPPAAPMQRPHGQQATYPPPYPPQHPPGVAQIHQAYMQDNRRASMPPSYPQQPPPQADMSRHPSQDHLQPPPPHARMSSPQPQRPSASPQPPQQATFTSPQMPQPRPLPAHAKNHSIFTPIDDSRSLLAQHWGPTTDVPAPNPPIKQEPGVGGPRAASIDVAAMQRGKANGSSPQPPPARLPNSPQPPQRSASSNAIPKINPPTRTNTNASDAKRPRLKVQIPSEQSGDEDGTGGSAKDTSLSHSTSNATGHPQHQQGPSHGVVLPPPSPSTNALLSAGAQGPPNPFARPAPPMSTNPHAMNREALPGPGGGTRENSHIETPISALPSRFMSDNLLPSPSTFYPEWGFGRSDSNMLPSPLNFQTPVSNGGGWRDPLPPAATSQSQPLGAGPPGAAAGEKRGNDDDAPGGSDAKRPKT